MIRFIFRLLALVSLAIAVIFAVLDATRSIAASFVVTTPLSESWLATAPGSFEQFQAWATESLPPEVWDPGIVFILTLPGFIVFAGLALILYALGRRPRRRAGRFAPET